MAAIVRPVDSDQCKATPDDRFAISQYTDCQKLEVNRWRKLS